MATVALAAVSQGRVSQDFRLSFSFSESLLMFLFAMDKGKSFEILSS